MEVPALAGRLPSPSENMKNSDVALVVIARDAGIHIGRLLSSVGPWVDRMLVLDTGSSDDTRLIAQQFGAQVEELPWPDDFSVARNTALHRASADWHLVLDADEWLIEGGEYLRQLSRLVPEFVGQVRLDDHSEAEPGLSGVAINWLSRLLPGAVRYTGRIHEQPLHRLPLRRTPLRVGHDGYSSHALAAKRGRNRRLLMAELSQRPEDPYLCYQLGKDAAVYEEHQLAQTWLERALELAPEVAPWRADLVARLLYSLKCLGQHARAVTLAGEQAAACSSSPDVSFALGEVLLDAAAREPAQATRLLHQAAAAWRRCLEIGERPDVPGAVQGRGSHLAAYNLGLVLEGTGRGVEAASLRELYGLDTRPQLPTV